MLQTAILIDGSASPVAIRQKREDRDNFISQGRAGETPRNFKFVRMMGEGNDAIALYRIDGEKRGAVTDEMFERQATEEADKFLHPEKYIGMGKQGPLDNSERAELERLRAQVSGK